MAKKPIQITRSNGYSKLLVILMCIAIIPGLLISALAYYVSIQNAKKEAVTYSTQYLNQIVESNSVILQQSKSIIFELMLNFSSYSDILRQPKETMSSLQLLQTLEKKKLASEPYIKSFYFIDKRSGKIYASDRSSIYPLEEFPDQNLVELLGLPNDELLINDLFQRNTSSGESVATYIARYPLTGRELGYMVIDLDIDRIAAAGQDNASGGGRLLIQNRHGDLINKKESEWLSNVESRPNDYVVIRQSSRETGLEYSYVIPRRELVQNSRILLSSILAICAVFILLEAAAAWFSSKKLYTPMRNLLQHIRQLVGDSSGHPEDQDEYYYVRKVIMNMNVQNNDYLDTFKANGALFKQHQMSRLLNGEISASRAMRLPENLKLKLPHENFAVFVMEAEEDPTGWSGYAAFEQELLLYAITNITEELLASAGEAVATPIDANRVAVLFNYSRTEEQPLFEHLARQVQTKTSEYLKITLSIGIGQPIDGESAIPKSFEQAQRSLATKVYYGKGSIVMSEGKLLEQAHGERNVSWSDLKPELRPLLQAGEREPIETLLRDWVDKIAFPGMTETDVQFYLLQYIACLSDLCADFSIDGGEFAGNRSELIDFVRQTESVSDLISGMLDLADKLLERIKATKEHIHQELIQNLLVYIREHLDQDLTLESLAEKVYMHPAYLSRICKSLTGKGLGEQIVHARIERAKELLVHSSLSVNDISAQLGYTNPRAFYRLFKEYTTMTPGEFRKNVGLRNFK